MPFIAFDTAIDDGFILTPPGTSRSFAVTIGAANQIIFVGLWGEITTDIITGATFAGSPMTLAGSCVVDSSERWVYLFYQLNPAVGVGSVVVSWTGSLSAVHIGALLYTNTLAFDQVTTNTSPASNSFATSLTPTIDQAWAIYITRNSIGTPGAGAGSIARVTGVDGYGFFDSGFSITPPQLDTMTATQTAAKWSGVMATFAPSVSSAKRFFLIPN